MLRPGLHPLSEHREWCQISREAGTVCAVCSVTGAQGACVCASQPAANISSFQRWRRCHSAARTYRGSRWIKPTPKAEADTMSRTVTELRITHIRSAKRPPLRGRDCIISASDTCSPQRALRGWLQPISLVSKRLNWVYIEIAFCLNDGVWRER